MKTFLKLLAFASIAILFTNCNKDDDDINSGDLVGTWALTEFRADDGEATIDVFGLPVSFTYSFVGSDFDATTTFTENPNNFTSTGSYSLTTTTDFAGQIETETTVIDVDESGSWAINGDKLSQFAAGDTLEFTILELSDSKLRLRLDLDETIIEQGAEAHDKATVFTSFEKQ